MNTDEINCIVKHFILRDNYLGALPSDALASARRPEITRYPCCYVANTDPSDEPGEHWVAFYYPSAASCEFFDSYASAPILYGFSPKDPRMKVAHNTYRLQSETSTMCGQFCILFLLLRSLFRIPLVDIGPRISALAKANSLSHDAYACHAVSTLAVQFKCPTSFFSQCCKKQCCTSSSKWGRHNKP